jgi:superfamily II DNA or RNA helicase
MVEFDAVRGFAGDAPGQDVGRVVRRLTVRDLELIVGPAVLPLLPPLPKGDRSALEAAAIRILSDRPQKLFRDPGLRRTILRNLDPGKSNELRHRLGDATSLDEAGEQANWEVVAGFFGLEAPEAAAAPSPVPVEDIEVDFGLFPHQRSVVRRALERIGDGQGRTLIHMPTGAGKTRTAMHLVSRVLDATEPEVVVWLASSRELVEQAAEAFQHAWSSLGDRTAKLHRFWGSYKETPESLVDGILVAGLGKMHSWREREPLEFQRFAARVRLVVIDEAHQAIAPTYRALIDDLCGAGRYHALLGLTATPGRTWNDVAADQELSDFFNGSKVVLEAGDDPNPVKYLLDEGYLARPSFGQIGYSPDCTPSEKELTRMAKAEDVPDDLLEELGESSERNLAIIAAVKSLIDRGHVRIIVFAVSVNNATVLADALVANGISAAVVTGDTPVARRAAILRAFKSTSPQPMVVCNFGVLTTGFDAPRTSAAIIARPTKSLVLFSQMVGRATRGPKAGGNATSEILTVHDPSYPGFGDIAEAFFNWEDVWSDR